MQPFDTIALWFDKNARLAKTVAAAAFDAHYPAVKRLECSSFMRDGSNIVVAVFYEEGLTRPVPYKVFVVNPVLKTATEIDVDAQPQYRLLGRK